MIDGGRRAAPKRAAHVIPKHVRHCYNRGARDWWIYTWKKCAPELHTRIPYKCNSWRCTACGTHGRDREACKRDPSACRTCARHDAAVQFARIKEATAPLSPDGFVFLVLTIDQNGYYSGEKWENARAAFAALSKMTAAFLARLKRLHIRNDWAPPGSKWVAVVEAHRRGWPHMNLLIHAPELARALDDDAPKRPEGHADGCRCQTCRAAVLVRGELAEAVTESGWGLESTAERARSGDSVASYIVKLAGEGGATAGELAKLSQAPMTAPERFHRLRSGKKFLPPRRGTKEGVTGTLIRRFVLEDGTIAPRANARATWEATPHLERAQSFERDIIAQEHTWRAFNLVARNVCPAAAVVIPPVSSWPSSPIRGPDSV